MRSDLILISKNVKFLEDAVENASGSSNLREVGVGILYVGVFVVEVASRSHSTFNSRETNIFSNHLPPYSMLE